MVGGRVTGPIGRGLLRVVRPLGQPLWRGLQWIGGHADAMLGLLALLMFVIGWSTMQLTHDVPSSLMPVLAVCEAIPIVLLRRKPLVAWAIAAAVSVLWWAAVPAFFDSPMPWPVVQFLVLLATIVAVGLWGRWVEIPIVIAVTGTLLYLLLPGDLEGWAVGQALIMAVAVLVRWLVISRRQIAVQQDEVETERARRAVVEERSRIARELHDVVAHHMSMIVVQAQSAPVRHGLSDPEVAGEFAAIEGAARQALTEVRSVLGVLRDENGPVETAPQPDLAQLPSLVKSSKAAGMPLTSRVRLAAGHVPPGTALVLYRVAQESLANAARHAPGAAVELTLEEDSGWARLMIRNSAPAPSALAGVRNMGRDGDHIPGRDGEDGVTGGRDGNGGTGIRGMSERVQAVGGTFEAQPVGDGFVVVATVPLTDRPQVAGLG
ncbi:histidine kinase [Knoellia sinensis KCTC 19936]|uniref:histidine kinase n=1 Tax=Knoellia sinensis KCTC 19936 TaxID=1385520 RepID=A0A0A0J2B5_9MICO|nr:histidine kinase [Knoellia sinensis]KGN30292.1 histidine kinase [Knoellia sinensis KCTC 19936]